MLVSEVLTKVQRTFGDEAAVQVTEADVIRWINQSQKEAVMQNEGLLKKIGYLASVADQDTYVLPTDLFTLHHVYYRESELDKYYKLRGLGLSEFTEVADGWDGSTVNGFPQLVTQEESNKLLIFPAPSTSVANGIKLDYSRFATDVTVSTDAIDLPAYYDNYVVNYCMMQAYELDEDWEAVSAKATQVQGDLDFNNNRTQWFNRDKYPTVNSSAEDYI